MKRQRPTKADVEAAGVVLEWARLRLNGVVRDPDVRLVPVEYAIDGMGTKVVTVRDGATVAWFDSAVMARRAIAAVRELAELRGTR